MGNKIKNEYICPKFKCAVLSHEIPSDSRLENLRYWCKIFHKYGLAPPYQGGSYGNLSFRLKDKENEFIITGSRIGLKDDLKDDCFVRVSSCDFQNGLVYAHGIREPSSESMLHYAIYRQRPDVNAIFHGHCDKILSNAKQLEIPETTEEKPYGNTELVDETIKILGSNNFIIMKNHGFISLGRTMDEAGKLTLELYQRCA